MLRLPSPETLDPRLERSNEGGGRSQGSGVMGVPHLGCSGTHTFLVPEAITQHDSGVTSLLSYFAQASRHPGSRRLRADPGEGPQIWAALGSLTQSAGGPGVPHTVSRRPWGPSYGQQEALPWSTLREGSQEYFLWCGAGVSLGLFIK